MKDLAEALVKARRGGRRVTAQHEDLPGVEQAYAVQDRVRALLGRQVAGWKVARTPDGEVISAPILDDVVFQSGDEVPLESRISHGFECELAFKVEHRLSGISRTAFELLSCRTEQGFQSPRPLLVADNLGSGGIVVGAPRADWRKLNLQDIGISLNIAGDVVVEKRGGNPIGDPLQAVVLLANHLARRGLFWEPGQVILTGAFAGVHHATVGQRIEACFEGFGPVTMHAVAVQHEVGNEADASR
jgi:2-keto-4-pentenoate hydratase